MPGRSLTGTVLDTQSVRPLLVAHDIHGEPRREFRVYLLTGHHYRGRRNGHRKCGRNEGGYRESHFDENRSSRLSVLLGVLEVWVEEGISIPLYTPAETPAQPWECTNGSAKSMTLYS